MSLLSLPVEILSQIINKTLPHGIESFALSCRAVYACAGPQIQRHNTLKKAWARVHNLDLHKLLLSLCDADTDPLAPLYVEELDMRARERIAEDHIRREKLARERRRQGLPPYKSSADEVALVKGKVANIKHSVIGSQYLSDASVDPDQWWEAVEKDVEEELGGDDNTPRLAIALLGLLPNLETLALPFSWHRGVRTDKPEIESILGAMVEGSNTRGRGPFASLKTLLPFCLRGYEAFGGLQDVEPLLRLTTLREIYLVGCKANSSWGIPFRWRAPILNLPLTQVELAYCCMNADGISELLKPTSQLNVFKYSHDCKHHGDEYFWDAGSFVNAVGQHAGSTVTKLAITMVDHTCYVEKGVGSLHSFSKLKDLEVDVGIFCGPPVESGQARDWEGYRENYENPWEEEDLPSLASMLPSSITNLQINADLPTDNNPIKREEAGTVKDLEGRGLKALLTNFDKDRQAGLPDLNKVVVRTFNIDAAQDLADAAGSAVEICDEAELHTWHRKFTERAGKIR